MSNNAGSIPEIIIALITQLQRQGINETYSLYELTTLISDYPHLDIYHVTIESRNVCKNIETSDNVSNNAECIPEIILALITQLQRQGIIETYSLHELTTLISDYPHLNI